MIGFSNNWEFTPIWNEEFAAGRGEAESVRLPHTVKELPLHVIDEESYQLISGYRKRFSLPVIGAFHRLCNDIYVIGSYHTDLLLRFHKYHIIKRAENQEIKL